MTMMADSANNHHNPRGLGFSREGLSSPQLQRKNFPSPWSRDVRGDSESVSAALNHSTSSSSPPLSFSIAEPINSVSPSKVASTSCSPPLDNTMAAEYPDGNNDNAARMKKPAWNKPSNGVVEAGPVMGAVSWPALSESTKHSPKSSLADSSSSTTVSDGSVMTNEILVIPHLPPKLSSANVNPNSNPIRTMPSRQRPKRGSGSNVSSGGGGPAQTGFTRPQQPPPPPPPPPPFPVFSIPPNSFGNLYRGSNWESRPVGGIVSQSHLGSDHRNTSRRGNYGPRGDGNYHNNFGGRRDRDRGNYSNARDVRVQPPRVSPRGFVRPPPPSAGTFVPSQPLRPFANPMGFPEYIYIPPMHMEALRGAGMPHFIPPTPVLMPVPEPSLAAMLIYQIEYYFSDANLVKDEFLKSNMDDQGWVSIALIASFPRVKSLTNNIQLILDSLRSSTLVEVQVDKLRRRNEWMKWIPPSRVPTESGLLSSGGSRVDLLATSFQNVSVEEGAANQSSLMGISNVIPEDAPGRHSSELTAQSLLSNGEAAEDTFSNQN